jgi:hypothetical protein
MSKQNEIEIMQTKAHRTAFKIPTIEKRETRNPFQKFTKIDQSEVLYEIMQQIIKGPI